MWLSSVTTFVASRLYLKLCFPNIILLTGFLIELAVKWRKRLLFSWGPGISVLF